VIVFWRYVCDVIGLCINGRECNDGFDVSNRNSLINIINKYE
jgi:hypothetical protein